MAALGLCYSYTWWTQLDVLCSRTVRKLSHLVFFSTKPRSFVCDKTQNNYRDSASWCRSLSMRQRQAWLRSAGRAANTALSGVLDLLPPSRRCDEEKVGAKHMLLMWCGSEWSRRGGPGLPSRGPFPRLRPRLTLAAERSVGRAAACDLATKQSARFPQHLDDVAT